MPLATVVSVSTAGEQVEQLAGSAILAVRPVCAAEQGCRT